MKTLVRYFFQGILITVPVAICVYVFVALFNRVGQLFNLLGLHVNPYIDPFIGVLMVFGIILVIGMIGSSILVQPFLLVMDRVLEKTPLVKTVYTSVKDLLSAFVGSKKKFDRPVLVTINLENNIQQLGFITQTDLHELGIKEGKVAVYLPMSYSFSGNLVVVPAGQVQPITSSSSETMKFIISGGVTDLD